MKWLRLLALLSGSLLLLSGCGQSVRMLSIHDDRLPLEARRWLADAEDTAAITAAWRDAARVSYEETRAWRRSVLESIDWPASSEAAAAQVALGALADARVHLAELELALAEAEHLLAAVRRVQVNAETAVRYDLRYYELEPLLDATKEARSTVEAAARDVAQQRLVVEESTTAWWQTFQEYTGSGGDPRILWTTLRASSDA